ncbi:MAG: hypothetical protein IJ530_07920 [Treponema sp.]|uniref:hypothetical protein n=1 Tax=Treponema sp. TaxID=166 RepID=UPI0025D491D6|nr:hypothetical protein [Treponema sp.]MBQ8679676.1 hypothetical protein [Treponema sp.]
MREIELKIPLTQEEFTHIEDFLLGRKKIDSLSLRDVEKILKNDEYFSLYKSHEERLKNKELRVIRIRSEKNSPFLPAELTCSAKRAKNLTSASSKKALKTAWNLTLSMRP